jgi:hypothetical protein
MGVWSGHGNLTELFDGDASTFYAPQVTSLNWWALVFDFGSAQTIAEVIIQQPPATPWATYRIRWWHLEGSDDSLEWVRYVGDTPLVEMIYVGAEGTQTLQNPTPIVVTTVDGPHSTGVFSGVAPVGPFAYRHGIYRAGITGTKKLTGTTAIDDSPDIPVGRLVRLYTQPGGDLVEELWSDPVTGAFEFRDLLEQDYFVVSHDHTGVYNATVRDSLGSLLEAM